MSRFQWPKLFIFLLLLGLFGCGSEAGPIEWATQATMVVGDQGGGAVQFLVNPEELTSEGTLTVQVDTEFNDRTTYIVQSYEIVFDFESVGTIRLVLNPNLESNVTVYKLNRNNQPSGTHTMNLNLIIETPEQNLVLNDLVLQSKSATLTLTQNLFPLNFDFMGEDKELQILALQATIPAFLITSDEDPL